MQLNLLDRKKEYVKITVQLTDSKGQTLPLYFFQLS